MGNRLVKYDLDPFKGKNVKVLTKSEKDEVLETVADLILENVLLGVSSGVSPVTGKSFKRLSKTYKAHKEDEGLPGVPNLEFSGEMLDALKTQIKKDKVRLIITDDDQAGKAAGHNHFWPGSKLPRRPFIPDEKKGETFAPSIMKQIELIVDNAIAEAEDG